MKFIMFFAVDAVGSVNGSCAAAESISISRIDLFARAVR
jgi:hypothetical protein